MKHRIAIYLIYDKDGIVDDYIIYYLKELKKVVSRVITVCNGKLSVESRIKLETITDDIFCRENVGFDSWGYKAALEYIGWENMINYDELVITNYTVFGPFYPFQDMFDFMDENSISDFWGVHLRYEDLNAKYFCGRLTKHGYMPAFPLSNFWVIRSNLLHSYEFKKYWDLLPEVKDYIDACLIHEPVFSKKMCDAGFVMDTYSSYNGRNICPSPTIQDALYQIETEKLPILRRRVFFNSLKSLMLVGYDKESTELFKYIKEKTDYDLSLIWRNLLRTINQNDLYQRMKLNFIVRTECEEIGYKRKLGLIFHIYYEELIEECIQYIQNFPLFTDIFITTSTESNKKIIENRFSHLSFKSIRVVIIPNRGRDISSLLVAARSFVLENKFEYVCFMHDKKMEHLKYNKEGLEFKKRCYDSIAGTKGVVRDIISIFDKNRQLGILSAPSPYHGEYYHLLGGGWTGNYKMTSDLSKTLGLNINISEDKVPIAPYGTCFWFRPEALKKLFDYEFKYEDFPEEPLSEPDNTVIHAIERLYGFVSQNEGYYMAYSLTEKDAEIEITNLTSMLQIINNIFCKNNIKIETFDRLCMELEKCLKKTGEKVKSDERVIKYNNDKNNFNIEEILESVPIQVLLKKTMKKIVPVRLWNYLRWSKWKRTEQNLNKDDFDLIINKEKRSK